MTSVNKTEWLQELLRLYEGKLIRYAARWLASDGARDIVQEVFLRLWRESMEELRGREVEWLFTVCRNLSLDVLKKETRVKKVDLADCDIVYPSSAPDSKMEQDQQTSALEAIMKNLPAPQLEVVRLKFQEGFSYKEISNITGHSVSYVGVLIHEAMTSLRSAVAVESSGGRK